MNNDYEIEGLQHKVEQLEAIVDKLERRIFNLENPINIVFAEDAVDLGDPPDEGFDDALLTNKCPTCRIDFTGQMGYVCNRTDCPMQPIITCGSSS